MRGGAELRLAPAQISFRVLRRDPEGTSPRAAARAVEEFLRRRREGLAEAVEVGFEAGVVVIRAEGAAAADMIREAEELLVEEARLAVEAELEVDPEKFAVSVGELAEEGEAELEREVLYSKVRYFPHPECQWFEISSGTLMLSDRQVIYEPEWVIMTEEGEGALNPGSHVIPLEEVGRVYRGEWWDLPCLMIQTAGRTYRYGWPAARGEPETEFDVDEWLVALRRLMEDWA